MASFKVEETYQKVVVEVTLDKPPKGLRNNIKQSVKVSDVLKYLQNNGIKVGECTQKTSLSNFGDSPVLSGFFVFDSTRPKMLHDRKTTKKTTTTTTPQVQETAQEDKSEPVLEEATQSLPETETEEVTKVSRRSRRKRTKSEETE